MQSEPFTLSLSKGEEAFRASTSSARTVLHESWFKSLDEALERRGFATVLFFRVVPIVPYEALNYVSGLSKIRFRDYAVSTFLGLLPGAAVAAFFGDSLTQPFSPKFIAAVGALVLLIAIPTVYVKLKRKVPHGSD